MDPLSVIASCVAIGTLVMQTGQAIADLRALIDELPQRLCAAKALAMLGELLDLRDSEPNIVDFILQEKTFEAVDCDTTDVLEKAPINLTRMVNYHLRTGYRLQERGQQRWAS